MDQSESNRLVLALEKIAFEMEMSRILLRDLKSMLHGFFEEQRIRADERTMREDEQREAAKHTRYQIDITQTGAE